jgi:general secretion pathway protein I
MKTPAAARRGFTLLEVLVATVIMAVAITGLMSAISTSLRSAARLTDYDRAVLFGRQKMDELLIAAKLPKLTPFEGTWDDTITGGLPIYWRARLTPFEMPPNAGPGAQFLERIQLEIWWMNQDQRRSFALEGFRHSILTPEDMAAVPGAGP